MIVFVQSSGPARGAILRVSIEDPEGNWNRFDLLTSTISFPTELPGDAFAFTPPPGITFPLEALGNATVFFRMVRRRHGADTVAA